VASESVSLFPRLITQFYDGQPILQKNAPLSEIPLVCLEATTAIEDRDFLEHGGVSLTGTLRAMIRNARTLSFAEGGSTITQQLVKNFFLNSKKTIRRKLEEQVLAVLLESQLGKDKIFEMYLNVIYMGQNGAYQIRGFGSASQYYFNKPVSNLTLPECALLAAVINNPGNYSPFNKPENAKNRRTRVLEKMREAEMIDENDFAAANEAPLPTLQASQTQTRAPYFVMSALKEFEALDIDASEGARIYTTLDSEAQTAVNESVAAVIGKIEKRIKKPSKQPLQTAVIVVDLTHAQVLALTGGRNYTASQFNRATDAKRQIGSIVKPFVYLPALADLNPLAPLNDEPFEWKVGKHVWKPQNYGKKFQGIVPLYYALANSMNVPTARVGQAVGLDKIIEALRNSGVQSPIPELPSLTLGAFELSPFEVAQGYLTLGRFGAGDGLHTVQRVEDAEGTFLFERSTRQDLYLDPINVSVLIGIMRQTIESGTARAVRAFGLTGDYAGKTGTTSDTKDAWFAGFNDRVLTVVWVGYDDNTVMGLTGGSAALPIWIELNKKLSGEIQSQGFKWPEGVEVKNYSRADILKEFPALSETEVPEVVPLVIKK
jgi:penicillin-binding protein 1B